MVPFLFHGFLRYPGDQQKTDTQQEYQEVADPGWDSAWLNRLDITILPVHDRAGKCFYCRSFTYCSLRKAGQGVLLP